ncbi:MAG: hypothetical protein ACPLKQ_07135 [Candidatus Bathyarchaeales archaeon]
MRSALQRLIEAFTVKRQSGYAYAQPSTVYETPNIALADVMKLYERDPTCKASVDLLAASAVGMGFYTTVDEKYERAKEAKRQIDQFNEEVNLDALLCEMAKTLIACGNDFWLKITPERLKGLHRLPVDAVEKIEHSFLQEGRMKIPYKVEGYTLRIGYGGETLNPEAVIHWRINCLGLSGFGTGVLQVLLHSLTFQSDRRNKIYVYGANSKKLPSDPDEDGFTESTTGWASNGDLSLSVYHVTDDGQTKYADSYSVYSVLSSGSEVWLRKAFP